MVMVTKRVSFLGNVRRILLTPYETALRYWLNNRSTPHYYQKGVTLIELLIYMAVFATILTVATNLFFFSKTFATQVAQEQEVDRNARVIFLEMTQTIRPATSVSSPVLGGSDTELYLNNNAIRYFVNGSGILQKTESSTTSDVTSDEVRVENLVFTTRGMSGKLPSVSVSFDLTSNTLVYGQEDYISKNFQTTIQLR